MKSMIKSLIPKIVSFFGGGGRNNTQSAPPPISDTARSVTLTEVCEVICSGGAYGIGGLTTRNTDLQESIFLDETPVRKNGVQFYKPTSIVFHSGYLGQPGIPGDRTISQTQVGALVPAGNPVTRSFINYNINAVYFKISMVLQKNIRDGNNNVTQVGGNSCVVNFYIKEGNGAWVLVWSTTLTGKFSSPYEIDAGFNVNASGLESQFSLRVERVTVSGADDTIEIAWVSYSELFYTKNSLKRLAYTYIQFDCETFGTNFPERRYLIDGMYLRIPSHGVVNSDGSITYSGSTWNGALSISSVPPGDIFAIIYYLLTDKIDGLGEFIDETAIDKWSLYTSSLWNNALVFNGSSNEVRFLYKLYISKEEEGWQKIDNILSGCFTRRYWEGGILKFTQDRPDDIFAVISNADIEGNFEYSSTNIYERTNSVIVNWINNDNLGKVVSEYVTIPEYVAKYGAIEKQVEAVGCTRRSQAIRYGKQIIYSENRETQVVSFAGRAYTSAIPIGKVILISDAKTLGKRFGGLIRNAYNTDDKTFIELDSPVEIGGVSGFNSNFYMLFYPDVRSIIRNSTDISVPNYLAHWLKYGRNEGRVPNGYLLYMQTSSGIRYGRVLNTPGTWEVLEVQFEGTNISPLPNKGNTWGLLPPTNTPQTFRVISKEPNADNLNIVNITATQYDEEKYALIERGTDFQETAIIEKFEAVKPPTNLVVTQQNYTDRIVIDFRWTPPINSVGYKYLAGYRKSSVWTDALVFDRQATFENLLPGVYDFRVQSVSFNGNKSAWVYSVPYTIS